VVAGKGNNGADGRAAARRLEGRGVRCSVVDAARPPAVLPAADLVIDAAYGTGFRGAYEAPAVADPSTPVLAVDIPSGVDGLTGVASGRPLPATRTVTFAAWKPGLLLGDGPRLAGEVEVADIGLDAGQARAWRVTADDVASWLPEVDRDTHKWKAAAWLVAGSPGMTGAARLAASSAMRSGAGYLRISTPGAGTDVDAPVEAVVTALGDAWADEVLDQLDRFRALGVGPGLGTDEAVAEGVRRLVAGAEIATVVDGDGLRALGAAAATVLSGRSAEAPPVVLTPHDGEFAALDGAPPEEDRFAAVRGLARATGAVVLLKGSTTLVAAPDGSVLVADAGDARLATAGSGDVLTGLILGLLAQGVAPHRAAAAGAFLHGRAGDLAWRRGLVAGDLVDHLPAAFAEATGGSIATHHARL
jgi:NAD(P)H-hydrate epimerase